MVAALYRRYRPETFAELIGQSQVTDPLRTALRTDRVNHAYLFSGPRGCGKTTSARILARCLNCAEGPTDTPCGVCPSCVELARDGSGSLDVVEIDAASHNGVDDARDLRERAVFAPARDRFKIFILDEAHMVTPQGFNALLKIVEEPPEHVKFIFATTEPEKVIGTIRSRTHHYPFRLVPPAQMLDYVQQLCESEKVHVEAGVLPLVVRAGGGSVRDTLSLLDQLIAGSENDPVDGVQVKYERAVALLGYTHGALLDEVVDALGSRDAAAAFGSVDRVIQTGQDPRRFVEDLLERLRDLIIVAATSGNAASVLRGVPQDQLDRMAAQSAAFGQAELSRAADVVNAALTEMTGATSPRLHLELMIARILVPASDDSQRGALARVERLERRIGVETSGAAAPAATPVAAPPTVSAPPKVAAPPKVVAPPVEKPAATPVEVPTAQPAADIVSVDPVVSLPVGPVTLAQVKDAWTEILDVVKDARLNAWMVVFTAKPLELRENNVLVLSFASQKDVDALKQQAAPGQGVGELLKKAFVKVLGFEPAFIARVDSSAAQQHVVPPVSTEAPPVDEPPRDEYPPTEGGGWAVVSIPDSEPMPEPATVSGLRDSKPAAAPVTAPPAAPPAAPRKAQAPAAPPAGTTPTAAPVNARYGEAVVRQLLNATFIEEQAVAPRVVPMPKDD
ncbi:DNA polymerase-3 subunit gamma/tau [Salinibacterium sp. CAN_S4]|uniref:DNA polymerase III subunit gamma and tau n=1 Tax=Salinibacterium sp. CAN_S4 TaxID=2787727 RepID=UPI0018EF6437